MYLNIENLIKFYSKDDPLIKDLNFSVNKGEFVSFIGESGSGKTTFLKCLAGLEKINSGKITLNNTVLDNKTTFIKPNHRKIGFIFQDYDFWIHRAFLSMCFQSGKSIQSNLVSFQIEKVSTLYKVLSKLMCFSSERFRK